MMNIVSKRDVGSALITGATTGFIAWRILLFLDRGLPLGIEPALLVLVIPLLWVLGVQLGYFLGQFLGFFNQFGKFAAIGFTNFAVDLGVLYVLIGLTGHDAGLWYTLFKTISFLVSMTHSYGWNKFWTFSAAGSHGGGREFASFAAVSMLSLLVNVSVASIVVNFVPPIAGLDTNAWAGVGAIAGSAIALAFSFMGFKLFVFKR